jgi:hypothetical protein
MTLKIDDTLRKNPDFIKQVRSALDDFKPKSGNIDLIDHEIELVEICEVRPSGEIDLNGENAVEAEIHCIVHVKARTTQVEVTTNRAGEPEFDPVQGVAERETEVFFDLECTVDLGDAEQISTCEIRPTEIDVPMPENSTPATITLTNRR